MSYRIPVAPTRDPESVEYWLDWLVRDRRLIPIAGVTAPTCDTCRGAVTLNDSGEPWRRCYPCNVGNSVRRHLAGLVSITYSTARSFEPLVAYFKDEGETWLGLPLGSLLFDFLQRHLSHIERTFGTMDYWTTVPSHPATRQGWDHMKDIPQRVHGWESLGPWNLDLLRKTRAEDRANRRVDPAAYQASRHVKRQSVLLIDDTFTTGATLCSAAAALRNRGAREVVGLTLGRQIRANYGTARDILEEQRAKDFDFNTCILE